MTQHELITHTLIRLARLGVREVCVAAGARNAPLVAALTASTGVRLWNFFEERSAAFFALGRIMVDRRPVAVVTTSGTAAAELLPAAIEAYYQALPLLLVTADRPERFRGSGAPQAIKQEGLFGVYAQRLDPLDATGPAELTAPLHLNLCLDEPLTPAPGIDFTSHVSPLTSHPAAPSARVIGADLVLAAGLHPDDAALAAPVLARLGLPIVAEATSNLHLFADLEPLMLRGGENALLQNGARHLLRLGAVPSWRYWRDLENQPEIAVTNVCRAPFPGLARREMVTTLPFEAIHGLQRAAAATAQPSQVAAPDFERFPLSEPAWMRHLHDALPPRSRVFLGNSLPIREWNLAMGAPEQRIHFYANRGANGIDGLISTFLGVAASHDDESWLVLGDLSALYDLAAPWILRQLDAQRVRIVIINNGGGKIFSRVASLRDLPDRARQVIENRHDIDFRPFAQLWGMDYIQVHQPADLDDLPPQPVLLEIRPDAGQTESFWQAWHAA